jgi:signal transduction histidine kinase
MHCVIGPGEFNLSKEETIHIYRIIQELLTNAIKYVSSGEINLSLTMEEGMLFILYQDSGPGFNMQAPGTKGLGILNIFERAKIIHGKAVLNSARGTGTKWNITIPKHQVAGRNMKKATA